MLIKWIRCQVTENQKSPFSLAQEQWSLVKGTNGFLGQIGGWDLRNPLEAGILSIWEDSLAYHRFMKDVHDHIFEKNQQKETYKKIFVNIYETIASVGQIDMTTLFGEGDFLRVAECYVNEGKNNHFEEMQFNVWNTGMTSSPGMRSGLFCRHQTANDTYLVATLWENEEFHQQYVDRKLPSLIKQSEVKADTSKIIGNLINLNPNWTVTP